MKRNIYLRCILCGAVLTYAMLLISCFEVPGGIIGGGGTHIHAFEEREIVKNPTCSEQGEKSDIARAARCKAA